jgi:hypothetical protein
MCVWFEVAVALFAEDLEDCEHSAPSSDYAIVYPRNPVFVLAIEHCSSRRQLATFMLASR